MVAVMSMTTCQQHLSAMDIDEEVVEVVESVNFEDLCEALLYLQGENLFRAAFLDSYPGGRGFSSIGSPASERSSEFQYHSAHLVGDHIPSVGPLALFTLANFSFTLQKPNHFGVSFASLKESVELCKFPNFRLAEFGFKALEGQQLFPFAR
ncbi:uncharacterized protein BYT42DRAFT_340610 [Radiomyces spectabilis]|uniref:uncharacterized protein n=1 Tax=Radiomyces spectabilis TaxID=64574 RepID=UPI00221F7257|nr:uncharacterized protein BYT42DRAFT_340610 [Radiomyces spectabilis]KAI8379783.1 hypothetical protein BYT42DRAFT_340610 [Radiomyces spectabilis]